MSPLQQMFATIIAQDESARAIEFAQLSAISEHAADLREAFDWARFCIDECTAKGIAFDEETLSHNVESNFPDLSLDDCDDITAEALAAAGAA